MPPAAPTGPTPGAPVLTPKSDVADVRKSIGVPYSPEPGPVMGQGYVGEDRFSATPAGRRANRLFERRKSRARPAVLLFPLARRSAVARCARWEKDPPSFHRFVSWWFRWLRRIFSRVYVVCAVVFLLMPTAGPLGDNFKNKPLLARLNWLHVPLLASTPILAIYGLLTATHDWRTWAFAVLYYFFSGLGITAGGCPVRSKRRVECGRLQQTRPAAK